MADSDDATAATPPTAATITRRRRRRSSGERDDALLDAMLSELGIPMSDSKKKKTNNPSEAADAVIELITPPRPARRAPATASREEAKNEKDVPRRALNDSILDLTTPTPPSSGKRPCRTSPRLARQSIVNLLSPESEQADTDNSVDQQDDDSMVAPSTNDESQNRRWNLLTVLNEESPPSQGIQGNDDDDSDEERLLREITETQTRIQVSRSGSRMTATRTETTMAASLRRHESTFSMQQMPENQDSDNDPDLPQPKKRGRQKKNKAPAPPIPAKEIVLAAVAVEKRLFESPVGAAIKAALENNTFNNKPVPFVMERAFESDFNVIQWERRGDRDEGADTSRYVIAMHYPAEALLELLSDHGYDALASAAKWVGEESLNIGRPKNVAWGSVILIVEGMDRALIARSKKSKTKDTNAHSPTKSAPITFSDLHELAFRLFMDTSVHTKFTCDTEATASYVALLTREIIVAAVKQSSQEEFLESVPRIHSFRVLPGSGSTLNPFANTWVRMLQMIPGVSEDRAQSVLDHFPSFQSLLRAYNDPLRTQDEKEELLADKLHDSRMESALSRRIYLVFCGWSESGAL